MRFAGNHFNSRGKMIWYSGGAEHSSLLLLPFAFTILIFREFIRGEAISPNSALHALRCPSASPHSFLLWISSPLSPSVFVAFLYRCRHSRGGGHYSTPVLQRNPEEFPLDADAVGLERGTPSHVAASQSHQQRRPSGNLTSSATNVSPLAVAVI